MLKITDENYDIYKKTFETIWRYETRLMNLDPHVDNSPIAVLNRWEAQSKSLAKRGLKEGLRDSLTMLLDLPESVKAELNRELISEGLPSLYNLISTIKAIPQRVLKRGEIKNLDEYYVIKEFLVDESSDLSIHDRSSLEKVFSEFEIKYSATKNGS